jgi:hypothetical protein
MCAQYVVQFVNSELLAGELTCKFGWNLLGQQIFYPKSNWNAVFSAGMGTTYLPTHQEEDRAIGTSWAARQWSYQLPNRNHLTADEKVLSYHAPVALGATIHGRNINRAVTLSSS